MPSIRNVSNDDAPDADDTADQHSLAGLLGNFAADAELPPSGGPADRNALGPETLILLGTEKNQIEFDVAPSRYGKGELEIFSNSPRINETKPVEPPRSRRRRSGHSSPIWIV